MPTKEKRASCFQTKYVIHPWGMCASEAVGRGASWFHVGETALKKGHRGGSRGKQGCSLMLWPCPAHPGGAAGRREQQRDSGVSATNGSLALAAGIPAKSSEEFQNACGITQIRYFLANVQLKLFLDSVLQKLVNWPKCCFSCICAESKELPLLCNELLFQTLSQTCCRTARSQGSVRPALLLLSHH